MKIGCNLTTNDILTQIMSRYSSNTKKITKIEY